MTRKIKKEALLVDRQESLSSATGSGSFSTSRTTKAGSSDDSLLGTSNASIIYSLAEADEKYKDFVYDEAPVFGQPITNMDVKLDEAVPVITIQEKYAGMDWWNLRNGLPDNAEEKILSKKNDKGELVPYIHEQTGNKVIVNKDSLKHFRSTQTSTPGSERKRRNTTHFELIHAVPQLIQHGIWIEEHQDRHGKAKSVSRIFNC